MADLIIKKRETTPQSLQVTAEQEALTIERSGSVIINKRGEFGSGDVNYAVLATNGTGDAADFKNTITLNGAVSIADKMTDDSSSESSHDTYGVQLFNGRIGGSTVSSYVATLVTDNASTIKATRDTTSKYDVNVYGIGGTIAGTNPSKTWIWLTFDGGEEGTGKFQDAITVTATNSNKTDAGAIYAYGIGSATGKINFKDELAAAIKVTATNKSNAATASGINGETVWLNAGVTKDISATATGAATSSAATTTTAYGIATNDSGTLIIAKMAGAITAKATGNAALTGDKTVGYAGNATAAAVNGCSSVSIDGDITKAITATATANSVKTSGKTVVGGYAMAYGIQASDSGVKIQGALAGAIKVTATSKANYARAYGIYTTGTVSVNGINAAITTTVNGADGGLSFAYGIRTSKGLTVNGDITKAITVKVNATPTGSSSADGYGIFGEKVDVKGDITGAVTATVTVNSVKQASGFAASGTASAFGIAGSSAGGTSISGKLAGAVKATATSKGNKSTAYGLYASNKTNVTVSKGITGAITATATGTAKVGTDKEGKGSNTVTNAYGIYTTGADGSVVITGVADKKGNITAIGGAITATATGSAMLGQSQDVEDGQVYMGGASAYGITATAGAVTITGDITKAITAKATTKAFAAKKLGDANGGDALAYALNAKNDVKIDGSITGAVKSTATANSVNLYGDIISGNATAYGINTTAALTITGTVKGTVSATATSKGFAATAYGIQAGTTITLSGNLTTVTARADGHSDSSTDAITATGIKATTVTLQSDVTSIGKITATATDKGVKGATAIGIDGSIEVADTSTLIAGTINATATGATSSVATGIKVKNISNGAILTLNITATSKLTNAKSDSASSWAIALNLDGATGEQSFTLKNSKLTATTAKVTNSYDVAKLAINGSGNAENITLDNSTLTGDVYTYKGDDVLTLDNKSKITGVVDMGEGNDTLEIYSGNLIKGDIAGVESLVLTLDDVKSTAALWQGEEIEYTSLAINANFGNDAEKLGKSKTFALLKDLDGDDEGIWDKGKEVTLKIDGGSAETLKIGTEKDIGEYKYLVEAKEVGNSTTLQLTISEIA